MVVSSCGWKPSIFNSYDDLPSSIQDHNTIEWADKQCAIFNGADDILPLLEKRNSFLIDTIRSYPKEEISVLDFAGGIGLSYYALLKNTNKSIDYHIVEVPIICDRGNVLYQNDPFVSFSDKVPEELKTVDVVHIRTSIQYVQDWKACIKELLSLDPKVFLLAHLSAGDIPSYLTLQLWGEYEIPYWFLNIDEVKDVFFSSGYECFFEEVSTEMKEDAIGWETHMNLPEKYRIDKFLNVGFRKHEK